ncbi:MAG: fatty acid desaturase [Acidimicrobiales bacterium]
MATTTAVRRVEWPTVAVSVAVYGSWLVLTLAWSALPAAVAVVAAGVILAWFGSLQHETVHGHPFQSQRWCDRLAALPLALWLPYRVYRVSHLAHHRTGRLTDPYDDPESWYVAGARWHQLGRIRRAVLTVNRTLAGRLLIGPLLAGARFVGGEVGRLRRGDRDAARVWARHVVAVAVIGAWLVTVGVPLWQYVIACYLSVSITLVRSYAEHRAVGDDVSPSAVVEAGPLMSLLFLNNNLHHTHHARPGVPWYRLPTLADALHSAEVAARGAGRYRGYTDLARRHLLRPVDPPVHPTR